MRKNTMEGCEVEKVKTMMRRGVPAIRETREDEERGDENETELRLRFVSLYFVYRATLILSLVIVCCTKQGFKAKEDRKGKRKLEDFC
ncbi:hypothetical protein Scep_028045 [Stephania cephalantha]|uniref:Uncharacterized protein n=1 Tax=Stephania cephalantha TaxID=152367 RepID=A0AAP0HHS3_9MAGN